MVCSQFLVALFIFFNGGSEQEARNFLSEFYQNMTVGSLSTDHSFQFDAFAEFLATFNILFRQLASTQDKTIKVEDTSTSLQLKQKYEIDDDAPPPPLYPKAVYTDPENVSEKIRQDGDVVEPKLETPTEIKQNDTQRKFYQVWLDNFLNGVKRPNRYCKSLMIRPLLTFCLGKLWLPKQILNLTLYSLMIMIFLQKTT